MSLELARTAYPLLVQLAREQAQAMRDHRTANWVHYDEFCRRCRDLGIKETPRTIVTKVLKPLQAACVEHEMPDLSALVIQKPRARGDIGNLLRPSDSWWEIYAEREGVTVGDVKFWFDKFRAARDHENWPETPFF